MTIWSPPYFGVNFALKINSDGTPTDDSPPPTGGTPAANSEPAQLYRMAA